MSKVRSDFVTNSSSSSFICSKCNEEINTWDWSSDYERGMCDYCYTHSDFNTNDDKFLNFINYLCEDLCLDKNRVINKYQIWRENNED